ncbi:hypothetical protein LAZ67_9000101 [Cordylochernes scorpioides]|uniref:Uncharacterized protein n=1 Tax=Cordylochernes scorpioides TaxID=51811 RepID=A0ABY6KS82_9ARAC|nr:hypothetical protein LAZ67_9000101 [Cordylochernes scorpioides]
MESDSTSETTSGTVGAVNIYINSKKEGSGGLHIRILVLQAEGLSVACVVQKLDRRRGGGPQSVTLPGPEDMLDLPERYIFQSVAVTSKDGSGSHYRAYFGQELSKADWRGRKSF